MKRKILFIAIYIILIALVRYGYENNIETQKNIFIQNHKSELLNIHEQVQHKINLAYQGLRTISRMPSVRNMDSNHYQLPNDTKKSITELYDNLDMNISLSEIYLVQADFNPEAIDPKTKKKQVPVITFDSLLKMRLHDTNVKISPEEEIEIFEYREMIKQLNFFAKNFSSDKNLNDTKIPMEVTNEVITCDNTYFDSKIRDNKTRSGLIFSIPFYNPSGVFKGMTSGVILSRTLRKYIPEKYFQIKNLNTNYVVGDINNNGKKSIYEETQELNFYNGTNTGWALSINIPVDVFNLDPDVVMTKNSYYLRLIISTILMIGAYYIIEQNMKLLESQQRALEVSATLSLLGEMAASIAHEINNPLAIIVTKVNTMKRMNELGTLTNEKVITDLDKIKSTTERITKIIRGLKSLSRNGDADEMSRVSFKNIVNDSLEFCVDRLKARSIELRNKCQIDDEILCRDVQLSQVIINLINNASDAIADLPEKWIELELIKDHERKIIKLMITDSGKGIPPEIAKKLMTTFFTTKEIGKGTGLGLSISRKIINEHGGVLILDQECKNTRFIIELPA